MKIAYLPANQAWCVLLGSDPQTASMVGISVGACEQKLWQRKSDLIRDLSYLGLGVNEADQIVNA